MAHIIRVKWRSLTLNVKSEKTLKSLKVKNEMAKTLLRNEV